ncbi:flavodoxin domain-containing protein [Halosquirtibacter xylanolyticus]|uniref:diflavin oxidoreductase n=1 Tax=Halosquirtibacter xylanolyticus TaxID=3374599 RepID=UPI003747F2DE|nr:flavodoxin domain-containing protein [Prolixibacteraceae bacterium]
MTTREEISQIENIIKQWDSNQKIWAHGFLSAFLDTRHQNEKDEIFEPQRYTILYGSQTGHSKHAAEIIDKCLKQNHHISEYFSIEDFSIKKWGEVQNLLIVVSTQGDGIPPITAQDALETLQGKRIFQFDGLSYGVLALGDISYPKFCQAGIDFFDALEKRGANPIIPIEKVGVDYEKATLEWTQRIIKSQSSEGIIKKEYTNNTQGHSKYNRNNPFFATILTKQRITGTDSNKEVYHIELSLEGSGLNYTPGDTLGIHHSNPPQLVHDILNYLNVSPNKTALFKESSEEAEVILKQYVELTKLSVHVLNNFQKYTRSNYLQQILSNGEATEKYLYHKDILDLLHDLELQTSFDDFIKLLSPVSPRLYSISSSSKEVGKEVHITTNTIRYKNEWREKEGACSTYISDRVEEGQSIPIFIESNEGFKLPKDKQAPVIMIGAGVGIAPYRSFIQEIDNIESVTKPKSWLFFGEQHFKSDFLYQREWLHYLKKSTITHIDTAFSRDQEQKVYVQHRIAEKQERLWQWINNDNAHIYICGDKKHMAKDVEESLKTLISKQGGLTHEAAITYLDGLKKTQRFQLDIY